MKNKIFLLLLSFICSVSLSQSQDLKYFYSIDDKQHLSEDMRDRWEGLLWQKIDVNFSLIKTWGNLSEKDAELIKNVLKSIKNMIVSFREQNATIKENYDVYTMLDIKLDPTYASNKEFFYMKEVADVYDIALDQFSYFNFFLEEVAKPENSDRKYSIGELSDELQSFSRRYDIANPIMSAKMQEVVDKTSETNDD